MMKNLFFFLFSRFNGKFWFLVLFHRYVWSFSWFFYEKSPLLPSGRDWVTAIETAALLIALRNCSSSAIFQPNIQSNTTKTLKTDINESRFLCKIRVMSLALTLQTYVDKRGGFLVNRALRVTEIPTQGNQEPPNFPRQKEKGPGPPQNGGPLLLYVTSYKQTDNKGE